MALPLKPHTATLQAGSDLGGTNETDRFQWTSGTTVTGHLVKLSAVEAFQQFGIETDFPAKWLQDGGALAISKGDRLSIGGEVYTVVTDVVKHDATGMLDYDVFLLQKKN